MYNDKEKIPVKIGDVMYNQKIVGVGKSGDGVTKVGAFVIFVPGSRVNQSYNIQIQKVLPTCAFAEKITDDDAF